MAAKKSIAKKTIAPAKTAAPVEVKYSEVKSTEVRNSPIPKEPVIREITSEMIAKRAFEIFAGGTGGSEEQNWLRAERELRAGL